MGFPVFEDMANHFGYVTDQDKEQFEQTRQRRASEVARARDERRKGRRMFSDGMGLMTGLGRDMITAKIRAEEQAGADGRRERSQEHDGPEM